MIGRREILRGSLAPSVRDGTATLPGLLQARASAEPGRLALRVKLRGIWRRYTWADYLENVRRFALFLKARGFQAGDRLAIVGDGCPEWFFADLAAQSLGGVTVGIYPTNPWPELQYIVRHSKSRFVVCGDQEQADKVLTALAEEGGLPDVECVVTIDCKGMQHYDDPILTSFEQAVEEGSRLDDDSGRAGFDQAVASLVPAQDAIIVYTSGTTGMPKGARIPHRAVITAARVLGEVYEFEGRELSALCYLPLCHVAERLFSTVVQLAWNGVVNFAESIDTVAHDLREIAPSYFLGVPRIWEKIEHDVRIRSSESHPVARFVFDRALRTALPIARRALDGDGRPQSLSDRITMRVLKFAVFGNLLSSLGLDRMFLAAAGGAPMPDQVTVFLRAIGLTVHQVYGMTETSGLVNVQRFDRVRLGWAGPPVPGIEQRVADDGELLVRGDMVFNGYLFDEAATAAAIEDGWLHTGDIAEQDPATGEIRIVDRKKSVIITSGGKNITPSLIENALKESPYIEEAILLGDGRHFLAALIQIDFDTVGKWAQERGIPYTNYQHLSSLDEVRELVDAHVQYVNGRFARVENVRKFVILRKQLDHDDGEVTATMKVRRAVIERKFAGEIAQIYGPAVAEA
ncbi:AMP-binding protein [Burkholderiaceae bacterium FT117]|uniref:AMP-dependent synthetase/ligase n=1 Tax=Zeimonas sediminis TaxID=2944268 RepID=UPI002342D52C|nr:AMP-binding protein [Zeimonas sediminis]MCM5571074.1 AMP-binding protein [Zeimonas sediminis]